MQTAAFGNGTMEQVKAWAASGAMQLTGRPDGPPLGPPCGLVPRLHRIADLLGNRTESLGRRVEVDPLRLLGERAALMGLRRQGATSCGGATRLLATRDGWIAAALSRPDDVDLVPAWLELPGPGAEPWQAVTSAAQRAQARVLVERAVILGLPVAELGERSAPASQNDDRSPVLPVRITARGTAAPLQNLDGLVVVDLTSLWAGPLCGSLLAAGGADVIKVEATHRPDGARNGTCEFFDLLNGGKRSVALDLRTEQGRRSLAALLGAADVVLEASRPRALEQLGIDRSAFLDRGRIRVWVSITGYGRSGRDRDRVAFGDDAAVAGGLVGWDDGQPTFCGDAVADPATGLVAAAALVDLMRAGGRWTADVAMADVAAHLAGPTLPVPAGVDAAEPWSRRRTGSGPALGQHTDEILSSLAVE